jgi:hypothetical protein
MSFYSVLWHLLKAFQLSSITHPSLMWLVWLQSNDNLKQNQTRLNWHYSTQRNDTEQHTNDIQ